MVIAQVLVKNLAGYNRLEVEYALSTERGAGITHPLPVTIDGDEPSDADITSAILRAVIADAPLELDEVQVLNFTIS